MATIIATSLQNVAAADILTVGIPQAIVGLDPHGSRSTERPVQLAAAQAFDTLVLRNGDHFEGRLAISWDKPDPQLLVFHLRRNVKFQDGSPFTAADVKASFDRVVRLNGPLALLFNDVAEVSTQGDETIIFRTRNPSGTLLSSLSLLFVGPAGRMDKSDFWQHPVGTGPFEVRTFAPGQDMDFSANPFYWDGPPKVSVLRFRYYPEIVSRITALETGEIDLTWNIPPDQIKEVADDHELTYRTAESLEYYFDWFNSARKPFSDARVRQAMWLALDIPKIVKYLYGDMASVALGPIPRTAFGAALMPPYAYDPDKARRLLSEAGYPHGFATTMQWNHQCCSNIQVLASTMISYWSKIGVKVTPLEKPRAQWQNDFLTLNWDMNLQTNAVLTGDADYALGRLYPCKAGHNGYCNPQLDRLLASAAATSDLDVRRDLYSQASQIIWDDAVGIFPMDLRVNAAWRKQVRGFAPPVDQLPRFYSVSSSKE